MKQYGNFIFIALICLFLNCFEDSSNPGNDIVFRGEATSISISNNDVFISGSYENKACYWKNNTRIDLTDGSIIAYASSIFINEDDIYIAGNYNLNACYWKNGSRIDLSNPEAENSTNRKSSYAQPKSSANSIFVDNGDIYITGYIYGSDGYKACYWKNNTLSIMSTGYCGHSIVVSNNDIYISGDGFSDACYWENGSFNNLPGAYSATSIFLLNDDIYISGFGDSNVACYWKNGVITHLTDISSTSMAVADSIYAVNNDIYVSGSYYNGYMHVACLWKNGVKTDLDNENLRTRTSAMQVSGNDIYISGRCVSDNDGVEVGPCYWKNGALIKLQ
ncbi:MAG: hypothetical protein GY754_15665 [bacterium]|nr:hypothetical protein [bacterium]